jgi:hypothetical protein
MVFDNMRGIDRGGTRILKVDGKAVAIQTLGRRIPLALRRDDCRVCAGHRRPVGPFQRLNDLHVPSSLGKLEGAKAPYTSNP